VCLVRHAPQMELWWDGVHNVSAHVIQDLKGQTVAQFAQHARPHAQQHYRTQWAVLMERRWLETLGRLILRHNADVTVEALDSMERIVISQRPVRTIVKIMVILSGIQMVIVYVLVCRGLLEQVARLQMLQLQQDRITSWHVLMAVPLWASNQQQIHNKAMLSDVNVQLISLATHARTRKHVWLQLRDVLLLRLQLVTSRGIHVNALANQVTVERLVLISLIVIMMHPLV